MSMQLAAETTMVGKIYNVLFLCTGNSARSIMAEAILNAEAGDRFRAFSAGSHPTGFVEPAVLAVLAAAGYETEGLFSKSWDEFAKAGARELDFVFTVCDRAAREVCPEWLGRPITGDWGVPDPAAVKGSVLDKATACAQVMRILDRRIALFVALPIAALDRLALKQRVQDIGKVP
jgi:arsenate reductase